MDHPHRTIATGPVRLRGLSLACQW
jgi:hypothetical protein